MTITLFVKPFIKRSKKEKAIAIIVYGGLGDGVLWIQYANDTIAYYKQKGYEVYLICNKSLESLYKNYTNFNKIIVVSNNLFDNFKNFKTTYKQINSVYFEEVIDIRLTKVSYQDIYLIRNMKAKRKIGYFENCPDKKKMKLQNSVFHELIKVPEGQHEINNHYYFLKNLGVKVNQDLFYLKRFVNFEEDQEYVSLCVGASDSKRMWGIDNCIKVVKYILDNTNLRILFCGSKQEEYVFNEINAQLQNDRLVNKCGKTSLQELIDILGNSKLVIANDSGPGHIASAVGAKGVILLGGGYNYRFFPHKNLKNETTNMKVISQYAQCWNCSWFCSKSTTEFPCIKKITPDMVISELIKIL